MDKDFLIHLTNSLYRLTILFPKKEPLRYRMRDLADEIMIRPNQRDLEALNSFFEVAKNQNWASPFDILAIQKEYANIREELEGIEARNNQIFTDSKSPENSPQNQEKKPKNHAFLASSERTERQERILSFLRENGRAQVWEVKELLPEVTKRTLRRDFEQMLEQGLVERIGEKNNTFYQVKTFNA